MLNRATTIFVIVVLGLATACTGAAPTPTRAPEPTATPAEVRATKLEHMVGIWRDIDTYYRFQADGTITWAESMENLDIAEHSLSGRCWFENGILYEELPVCEAILVQEAYLRIEEGRAVRLRQVTIEKPDPPCPGHGLGMDRLAVRVD